METMDGKRLRHLYWEMLRIRMTEERVAELYPEQEMRCPVHLCIGQEAVAVGVCANLAEADYVMSNHRSHGHYLAKGGDLKAMLAELYGKATGCSGGKGGSMHLVDLAVGYLGASPIVGSTIPIAVGAAFGSLMRGEERVTIVFFGDGATEEGVFHESLNFAALKKLPIVFVCENNLYSVYSPLAVRQPPGREVFWLGQGHGIPSFQGDGNDVAEVYSMVGEAVARARGSEGPTLLEFKTYRWREHVGPYYDTHLGYRSEEELQEWRRRCPVATLRSRLMGEGVLGPEEHARMEEELKKEIKAAVAFAKESPFPEEASLMEQVYAS